MEPSALFSLPNLVSRDSNWMFNFFWDRKLTLLLTLSRNKMWSLYNADLQVPFYVFFYRA